jgi:hypothetical protein
MLLTGATRTARQKSLSAPLHRERLRYNSARCLASAEPCFPKAIVVLEPDRPETPCLVPTLWRPSRGPIKSRRRSPFRADRLMAEEQGLIWPSILPGCGAGGHDWTSDHVEIEGIRVQTGDGPEFTDAVDLRGPARHVVHVHEADVEIENGVSARPPQ